MAGSNCLNNVDRGPDQLRRGRERELFERRARRRIEGLCRRDAAALDAPGRRLYRTGIRPRLRKPFGLISLLHRLGLEYHKPDVIPRKLNKEKQQAFIESYDNLLNSLADNEAVLFADAVHPTHAARPAGCWAPRQEKLAIEQTSGRERMNIHGAIDLATGQTRMIEVVTVDAVSTIRLLESIAALYPMLALIHVFLDNARYHHAKLVQEWLARPGCRIKLHFIPSYCPHLNPIERLWGLMHRNVTHNKCYATCAQFADATLGFLRKQCPGTGRTSVIGSPTISASSTQRIFGS